MGGAENVGASSNSTTSVLNGKKEITYCLDYHRGAEKTLRTLGDSTTDINFILRLTIIRRKTI